MDPTSFLVVCLIVGLIVYINKADTKKRAFPRFVQNVVRKLDASKPIFSEHDVCFEYKHARLPVTLRLAEEKQTRSASLKMCLDVELKSLPKWFRIIAREARWIVEVDGTNWSGDGPQALSTLFALSETNIVEHQSIPMTINELLKCWNYGLFDRDSTWSLSELTVEDRQVYFVATMPWQYASSTTLTHETVTVVDMVVKSMENIAAHLPENPWAFWFEMDKRHVSGASWSIASLCWMLRTHAHRSSVEEKWLHAVEHAPVEFLVEPASQNLSFTLNAIVDAPWDDAYYLDFLARANTVLVPHKLSAYEEILDRLVPVMSDAFPKHATKRHGVVLKDIALRRLAALDDETLLEWVKWMEQASAVELSVVLMAQGQLQVALLEVVAQKITQPEHGEAFTAVLYNHMQPDLLAQARFVALTLSLLPYTKTPQVDWLIEALQAHIGPDGFAHVRKMQRSPEIQNAPTRIRYAYRDIIEALEARYELMGAGGLSLSAEPMQDGALSVSQMDEGQLSITDEDA